MHILAGVDTRTANLLVRAELAKADVPAFSDTPEQRREVQATIVGKLQFSAGQTISFRRAWYYWVVETSHPLSAESACGLNTRMGKTIRAGGYAGGRANLGNPVYTYHVDTQEGLNELVSTFVREFSFTNWCTFTSKSKLGSLGASKHITPPTSKRRLASIEITGLVRLSRKYKDCRASESVLREALNVAAVHFGQRSEAAMSLRRLLVARYRKDALRLVKFIKEKTADDNALYCTWANLEEVFSKCTRVLYRLGRFAEARIVKRLRDESRIELAGIYFERIHKFLEDICVAFESETVDTARVEYLQYQIAFTFLRLSQLFARMNNKDNASGMREVAFTFRDRLSPEYRRMFDSFV